LIQVDVHDKRHRTALFWAVASKNAAAVELLMRWKADINALDDEGYHVIHWAATRENIDMLAVLARSTASVKTESKNDVGFYPLHMAAADGRVDNVNLLLDKMADIEAVDKQLKRTALIRAVECGELEVVKTLLKRKASTSPRTSTDFTALTLAVLDGRVEIAKELLANGADITEMYKRLSLLTLAARGNQTEMVAFLLQRKVPVDQRSGEEFTTALQEATLVKNAAMINLLIRHGASVNVQDINLCTPLHRAAFAGDCEVLTALLSKADKSVVNAKADNGCTALHTAAAQKHVEAAKLLIKHKAKVTAQENDKHQPLHFAASADSPELINLFIKEGASVKAKNGTEDTPLHLAAGAESVDALLSHRAPMELWNKWTQTPLQRLVQNSSHEAVRILLRRGARIDAPNKDKETAIMLAIVEKDVKMVELLLEFDASVTVTCGKRKLNSMHAAVETPDITLEIVEKLLDKEPKLLNIPTKEGSTPLYLAIDQKNVPLAMLLLNRGADTECKRADGLTPCLLASYHGLWEPVRLLVKKRCTLNIKGGENGATALHFTAAQGEVEIARMMIQEGLPKDILDAKGFTPAEYAQKHCKNPTAMLRLLG
jgi:ankyrin